MKQEKIRETIKQLVAGNLRWCDPGDRLCLDRAREHNLAKGFTFESAEEVLDDIIVDLQSLQYELNTTASFNSAQL